MFYCSRHNKRTLIVLLVIGALWYFYVTSKGGDQQDKGRELRSGAAGGARPSTLQERMQEVLAAREWLAQNSAKLGPGARDPADAGAFFDMDPYSANRLYGDVPARTYYGGPQALPHNSNINVDNNNNPQGSGAWSSSVYRPPFAGGSGDIDKYRHGAHALRPPETGRAEVNPLPGQGAWGPADVGDHGPSALHGPTLFHQDQQRQQQQPQLQQLQQQQYYQHQQQQQQQQGVWTHALQSPAVAKSKSVLQAGLRGEDQSEKHDKTSDQSSGHHGSAASRPDDKVKGADLHLNVDAHRLSAQRNPVESFNIDATDKRLSLSQDTGGDRKDDAAKTSLTLHHPAGGDSVKRSMPEEKPQLFQSSLSASKNNSQPAAEASWKSNYPIVKQNNELGPKTTVFTNFQQNSGLPKSSILSWDIPEPGPEPESFVSRFVAKLLSSADGNESHSSVSGESKADLNAKMELYDQLLLANSDYIGQPQNDEDKRDKEKDTEDKERTKKEDKQREKEEKERVKEEERLVRDVKERDKEQESLIKEGKERGKEGERLSEEERDKNKEEERLLKGEKEKAKEEERFLKDKEFVDKHKDTDSAKADRTRDEGSSRQRDVNDNAEMDEPIFQREVTDTSYNQFAETLPLDVARGVEPPPLNFLPPSLQQQLHQKRPTRLSTPPPPLDYRRPKDVQRALGKDQTAAQFPPPNPAEPAGYDHGEFWQQFQPQRGRRDESEGSSSGGRSPPAIAYDQVQAATMLTRDKIRWGAEECPPAKRLSRAVLTTPLGNVGLYMEVGSGQADPALVNNHFATQWNLHGVGTLFDRCLLPNRNLSLVDVGSGVGQVALTAGYLGYPVYAVEPVDERVTALCHSVTDHGYSSVKVIHNVAAEEHGVKLFLRKETSADSPTDTYTVETRNRSKVDPNAPGSITIKLDDILRLYKITSAALRLNVDGYEGRVLAGANKFLNTVEIPCILMGWRKVFPLKDYGGTYVFNVLSGRGFFPHDPATLRPLRVFKQHTWPDHVLWAKLGSYPVRLQ